MGEVDAIMRTANGCPAWSSASEDYIQSQASYAARALSAYGKSGNNIPNSAISDLNSSFGGLASFELRNNKVSVSYQLKGVTICGSRK